MSDILDSIRKAEAQRHSQRGYASLAMESHAEPMLKAQGNTRYIRMFSFALVVASSVAITGYSLLVNIQPKSEDVADVVSSVDAPNTISLCDDAAYRSAAGTCHSTVAITTPEKDQTNRRQDAAVVISKDVGVQEGKLMLAEQPVDTKEPTKVDGESETDDKPDEPTTRPVAPERPAETAVARSRATSSIPHPDRLNVRRTNGQTEQASYHRPLTSNPLNNIQPPLAVEVQEFGAKGYAATAPSQTSPVTSSEVPYLSTLSYQYQTMVPKMTINAQVYSGNRADRFVVINMKRYNEGQRTSDGVTVETIRAADIIFSYQGQRFRLNR